MKYTITTTLALLAALGNVQSMSWNPVGGSGGKVDFIHFKDGGGGSPRGLVYMNDAGMFAINGDNPMGFNKRQGGDIGHGGGNGHGGGISFEAPIGHVGAIGHGGESGGDYDDDSHDPKFAHSPVKVIRVYEPKPIPVAVPKPFPVHVPKPYAVYVPVQQRIEVPVIKHVQVKVDKPYHVTVEKHVPEYVEKPYPITVEKHVFYDVPRPYPVHYPVYKHVYLGHGHGH